ncbi:DUF3304 domain-containing protein [Paraburkholderia sacchari]|uniref:DUF3304 domain-containing protein n=1 Tax=Paraburkholderia sacchari TaxID=159450 RepID=UPI0039A52D8F
MKGLLRSAVTLALLVSVSGCAASGKGYGEGIPDVGVRAANYTENYITEFYLSTTESGSRRFAGTPIKEFSRGGVSGGACCFSLARPGKEVRVEWYTGQRNDPESRWIQHSEVTRAAGTTSDDPDSNISLIVRFFPGDRVEAEYVVQEEKLDSARNPRFDAIFTGQHVMRHIGE